ncbi:MULTISPECIES: HopJ type III effector protein [unclassified Vibrio]|uniref:HopJ type III effector protein n=1 Tax=Vibrio sp. HB236076 TaxID=3232307 RepID=A0AB39HF80_9VIBR|nr:HopJ type III effector protein [Vibrio sp. HB161653]MDP5253193.1 HopJ type III effector protein [Vibrio sp. HB161653]
MNKNEFLAELKANPQGIEFEQTMAVIDAHYTFSAADFTNGEVQNAAGQNNGSAKILAFGIEEGLSEQDTLHCFGRFYRQDVLQHPDNDDHQNIRNFIRFGWQGVSFTAPVLTGK